jgi:hypothetical protein
MADGTKPGDMDSICGAIPEFTGTGWPSTTPSTSEWCDKTPFIHPSHFESDLFIDETIYFLNDPPTTKTVQLPDYQLIDGFPSTDENCPGSFTTAFSYSN